MKNEKEGGVVAVDDRELVLVGAGRGAQDLGGGMLAHQWHRCKNSSPPASRSLQYVCSAALCPSQLRDLSI